MPVRSLNSSVLKWPDHKQVDRAVREWARATAENHANICTIGYFGSYARGNWGIGSDLDIVVIIKRSDQPFENRNRSFDTTALPVPADLVIYTKDEWKRMEGPFRRRLAEEVVWIF